MKKILSIIIISIALNGNAQVEKKFRVGLDVGYIFTQESDFGLSFTLEPKYNIKKNINIGLRLESMAAYRHLIKYNNVISGVLYSNDSYTGTFDYYFDKSNKNFILFVGGGLGINRFENKFVSDISDNELTKPIKPKTGLGVLLRSGFEWGKFRTGIDYNIVPSSNMLVRGKDISSISPQNDLVVEGESFSNSYLSIHLGFYIGGGKWKGN